VNNQDSLRFAKVMTALYVTFDKSPSETVTDVYFTALAEFDIEQVERAASIAIKSCKFFPKPVELRELLTESPDDQAQRAWVLLQEAYKKAGYWHSLWVDDGALARAIETTFGGWVQASEAFHDLSPEMLASRRKEFAHNYRLALKRPEAVDRYFMGLHESQNAGSVGGWKRGTFADDVFFQKVGIVSGERVALVSMSFDARTGRLEDSAKQMLEGGSARQLVERHEQLRLAEANPVSDTAMSVEPVIDVEEFSREVSDPALIASVELLKQASERKSGLISLADTLRPQSATDKNAEWAERRALIREQLEMMKDKTDE
jgi:hypothetical protein